jgi:hypothetical protein
VPLIDPTLSSVGADLLAFLLHIMADRRVLGLAVSRRAREVVFAEPNWATTQVTACIRICTHMTATIGAQNVGIGASEWALEKAAVGSPFPRTSPRPASYLHSHAYPVAGAGFRSRELAPSHSLSSTTKREPEGKLCALSETRERTVALPEVT